MSRVSCCLYSTSADLRKKADYLWDPGLFVPEEITLLKTLEKLGKGQSAITEVSVGFHVSGLDEEWAYRQSRSTKDFRAEQCRYHKVTEKGTLGLDGH